MDKSWLDTGDADLVPQPERDSYQLTLKEPSDRQRKGNDQGNRAPNRSKRMRAIVESAIIVLKALLALLALIRIFLT
ncbi:hypothetical protein CS369_04500 [Candidatus Symbiopectobacterium sp. 'North America']|uniref:hypothetical protein n=1 Tax=Candidatus Symbiopectobacterium sp. 'North America' TaxID=2794574 RepID=UPI0018CAF871|nr:hypothetical protein [Candidatus Symbiopectobacterium sp. 'North America']MBG6244271.1 hypothetical protein [Candidatus Symbiopectobacterium sp. 'North America']